MRVLVVTQYFWPENFRINDLVRSLVGRGLDITVITGKPNYPEGRIFDGYRALGVHHQQYEGADVWRLPIVPRGKSSHIGLVLNYFSFIFSACLLAPMVLRRKKFDLVFIYGTSPLLQALPAIFAAWIKRAPVVICVQDLWPESLSATGFVHNRMLLNAVGSVVKFIYRSCDMILIQSEGFRQPIERLIGKSDRIRYQPNSVEQSPPAAQLTPRLQELITDLENGFSVVFAGNLGAAQSLETVLDAAEKLRQRTDIRFFLVGSGSRSAWLAEEIRLRKLENVILPGRFEPDEMHAIFSAASALLVTLRDEAIFGYTIPSKIQAYLAAGRPILAAVNGEGAKVVAEANAGFACAADNAEALAQVTMKLRALSPSQLAELGENGRKYFLQHFEHEKLLSELINHFESVKNPAKEKVR